MKSSTNYVIKKKVMSYGTLRTLSDKQTIKIKEQWSAFCFSSGHINQQTGHTHSQNNARVHKPIKLFHAEDLKSIINSTSRATNANSIPSNNKNVEILYSITKYNAYVMTELNIKSELYQFNQTCIKNKVSQKYIVYGVEDYPKLF